VHNVSAGPAAVDERPAEERASARARDPLERLARALIAEGRWTAADRARVDRAVEVELDGGLGFARNSRRPDPKTAFDYMYAATYPGLPARGSES
jgi:TPP-dependent pyruvate/acetoin dehydrogenase alpha subunit